MRRWSFFLLAGALGVAFALPALGQTPQQVVSGAGKRISELEDEVRAMGRKYLDAGSQAPAYQTQAKINDGQVYYLLKDYTRASIIFFDVIDNPKNQAFPGYREALYYLADSLYEMKDYLAAARYFHEVVASNDPRFFHSAILRLLQIALITARYDEVDQLYNRFRGVRSDKPSHEVHYLHSRTLYERNRHGDAMKAIMAIPAQNPYYMQSRYYAGVIMLKQKRIPDAIQAFQDVLKVEPTEERQRKVTELAHLALGRLYYEQGKFTESIDEYNRIPHTSSYFDSALYEVCWTYIKREDFKKALQTLDIMLLSLPESIFAPDAQVLRGNLLLRVGNYADATDTYQEVVDKYRPIRDQMDRLLQEHADPVAYFNDILMKSSDTFNISKLLPPLASQWLKTEEAVSAVFDLAEQIQVSQEDMDQAEQIVGRIQSAIKGKNRIEMFPVLKQGRANGLEIRNEILDQKRRLLAAERALLEAKASEADRGRMDAAQRGRRSMERNIDGMPKTTKDYRAREEAIEQKYRQVEKEVFRLGYDVDSVRAQLVAIEKLFREAREQIKMGDEESQRFVKRVEREFQETTSLYRELEALKRNIVSERLQVGVGDESVRQENEVKDNFNDVIRAERVVLRQMRDRLGGGAVFSDIDSFFSRMDTLEGQLRVLFGRLDEAAVQKTREIQAKLERERVLLARYRSELVALKPETQSMAGRIAYENFHIVQRKFHDLILEADVGIIDVAWRKKEEKSEDIQELVLQEKDELRILDEDFQEVLTVEGEE